MKIVILGAGGRLGAALLREYRDKFEVTGFDRTQLDLSDLNDVREKLQETGFDVLINAAGFTKVDLCETQPERAFLINAEAPRILAEICGEKSARLIHFSTDYVFDGEKREPYSEEDEATPISVYGEAPAPEGVARLQGILHFANTGHCNWQEYAQWALDCCHDVGLPLRARTVGAGKLENMSNWIARRPVYSVLSTAKYSKLTGISPRTWRKAVSDYITRFYTKK